MKLIKTIYASLSIIFLLSSCYLGQKSGREIMSEIYSDVMTYGFSDSGRENFDYCGDGDLTISSLTEYFPANVHDWKRENRYFPQLERGTLENFLQVNSEQVPFRSDLDLGCKYTLVDIKPNPTDASTENCVTINFFSQIGFNSSKDQALVSRVTSCGSYSCGSLYFVELIDDHWVVTDLNEVICI